MEGRLAGIAAGRAKDAVEAGGGVLVTTGVLTTLCGGRATVALATGRAATASCRVTGIWRVETCAEATALAGTCTATRATGREAAKSVRDTAVTAPGTR